MTDLCFCDASCTTGRAVWERTGTNQGDTKSNLAFVEGREREREREEEQEFVGNGPGLTKAQHPLRRVHLHATSKGYDRRQRKARQDKARQGESEAKARHGEGKAKARRRQGKARRRQGKARQGKASALRCITYRLKKDTNNNKKKSV